MKDSILIVDDEQDFVDSMKRMLLIEGYERITTFTESIKVLQALDANDFEVAFLDITMPGMDGLELLRIIKERSPDTECIMITANESIPSVIRAVKLGAYDYLVKPIRPEQLTLSLDKALERKRLLESLRLRSMAEVKKSLDNPEAFAAIVTADSKMIRLLHEAELHAPSDIPILITGETGVGKELLAHAIHAAGARAVGPFVAVNMLALSPNLFESEFFGHAKGSFTGADREKAGYLAQGKGGTLFLDEIGDLPYEIQGKLLRILQEREYIPVGKTRPERADLRFIAATNQDLEKKVRQGEFRKDLFYRLQFAYLHLPPLRERLDDIPLLVEKFIKDQNKSGAKPGDQVFSDMMAYDWPGNVRELKGALEAALNLAGSGPIRTSHLRIPTKPHQLQRNVGTGNAEMMESMTQVEKRHILAVYEATGYNKSHAARVLEIGLQTLHRKLRSYGVM